MGEHRARRARLQSEGAITCGLTDRTRWDILDDSVTLNDIYFPEKPIVLPTDEHILNDSLGGRLTSPDLIDRSTNSTFGSTIDADLSTALLSIRLLIDARSATCPNNSPRALQLQAKDGRLYLLEAGRLSLVPKGLSVRVEGGEVHVAGELPIGETPNDLRNLLRRQLRRKVTRAGLNLETVVAKAEELMEPSRSPLPEIAFGVSIYDAGPCRAIAKIACNLLAHYNRGIFTSSDFDGIRRFVAAGESPGTPPVQATIFDINDHSAIGPMDHLIRIDGGPNGITALVVLYSAFAFVVRLATPGAPCAPLAYRVDQLGRADRRNDPRDLTIPVPGFDEKAAQSDEAFLETAETHVRTVVPRAMEQQQALFFMRIRKQCLARVSAAVEQGTLSFEMIYSIVDGCADEFLVGLDGRLTEIGRQQRGAVKASFMNMLLGAVAQMLESARAMRSETR